MNGMRDQSVDLVKILAMMLVVCLHTVTTVKGPHYSWVATVLYNMGVIAIPLFFTVSGYLLVGRRDATYKYAFKKILAIIRYVFIIVGLTGILFYSFSWWDLEMVWFNFAGSFIGWGYYWFFWFLGSMILIYLLYPLINKLFKNKSAYLVVLVATMIIQNCFFIGNFTDNVELKISQTFRMWNWLSYFMLGGLIKGIHLDKKLLLVSTVLSAAATSVTMLWLYPKLSSSYCEYFYGSPAVVTFTLCIFMLITSCHIKNNGFIRVCSSLFLPVYTIHPIVIIYIKDYFHGYIDWLSTLSFGYFVYWISVLLLTCLISYLIMKIPYMNRVFRL